MYELNHLHVYNYHHALASTPTAVHPSAVVRERVSNADNFTRIVAFVLHFHDIAQLLAVLQKLREHGNTIVIIEHNLDVIKTADWLVDMG